MFRYDCASGNTSFKQSALFNKQRSYDPTEADIGATPPNHVIIILVEIRCRFCGRWNITDVLYCLFTLDYIIIYTRL